MDEISKPVQEIQTDSSTVVDSLVYWSSTDDIQCSKAAWTGSYYTYSKPPHIFPAFQAFSFSIGENQSRADNVNQHLV